MIRRPVGRRWYVLFCWFPACSFSAWESVGQYLSKTYLEVKKRPIYLVKEEL